MTGGLEVTSEASPILQMRDKILEGLEATQNEDRKSMLQAESTSRQWQARAEKAEARVRELEAERDAVTMESRIHCVQCKREAAEQRARAEKAEAERNDWERTANENG